MKKILSLVMVVAMLVAVLALVGCNDTKKPDDTTTSGTTEGTTTSGTTEGTTTSGTTEGTTTSGTTEGTTTSETTESDTTTTSETTTPPPVFARFDFGTASKAQDLEMTSHEYLVGALTYNAEFISVDYTEDTIIVTAVKDHPTMEFGEDGKEAPGGRYEVTSYALCFEDIVTYDFDDELVKANNFLRFRIKNNTTNNIMSMRFRRPEDSSYFTTTMFTCMYLQGGAPTVDDYVAGDNKLTCEASEEYGIYTYDINFLAAMGRSNTRGETQGNSYVHMAYYVGTGGGTGSNNWNWAQSPMCSLQFYVLGAYAGNATLPAFKYGDTRANIVAGATVEIDYIIFGAKADLNSFTSYLQDAYNESVSISKSISVSESEAAAATATTAAA